MTNDGTVDVRIIYDHRVLNGGMVGRMLVRLEQILNSIMRKEIQAVCKLGQCAGRARCAVTLNSRQRDRLLCLHRNGGRHGRLASLAC